MDGEEAEETEVRRVKCEMKSTAARRARAASAVGLGHGQPKLPFEAAQPYSAALPDMHTARAIQK